MRCWCVLKVVLILFKQRLNDSKIWQVLRLETSRQRCLGKLLIFARREPLQRGSERSRSNGAAGEHHPVLALIALPGGGKSRLRRGGGHASRSFVAI